MNIKKRFFTRLFITLLGLVLVVVIFIDYFRQNIRHVLEQNQSYVEDAAEQTAYRIEDILENGQSRIQGIAYLCGRMEMDPRRDYGELAAIAQNASFDTIEFITRDGISYNAAGQKRDVADREYYRKAMEGEAGIDFVFDSQVRDTNVIVFYAPLQYGNSIEGALAGYYYEERIEQLLQSHFFDEEARTVLCTRTGQTVAKSGGTRDDSRSANVLQYFEDSRMLSQKNLERIKEGFINGENVNFIFNSSYGTGNGCVLWLPQQEIALVQTFPSRVINQMTREANRAGIILGGWLVLFFAIYFAVMFYNYVSQRRKLIEENRQMSSLVGGVNQLFTVFIVVDLENNTYEYAQGTEPMQGIERTGRYTDFVEYFKDKVLIDTEEGRDIHTVLGKENIQKELAGAVSYVQYEYRIMRLDKVHWENGSVICLERKNDLPVRLLLAIQDITGLKEEELRNREALREAFQSVENANHAKSDFLSRMSHDIRTPLNAIMGMTAIAGMHIEEPERVKDCLKKINVSSKHLLGLINEILDLSKIESGKINLTEEEFSLADTVDELLTIFHTQIRNKRQHLKINLSGVTHEHVVGDQQRLMQVLVNILGNAVKFTPEEGLIFLSIQEKDKNFHGNGCYEFIFEDNGIGMEKEFLDEIFEPFARANDSRTKKVEGTGLGMPIARNIARMMNGDIEAESVLGKGSRFTVTVFLKQCLDAQENLDKLAGMGVLVVDDDQVACESASALLKDIGMNAVWVLSGQEALSMLEKDSASYVAVILDWKMPEMDGLETAREIRNKVGKDLPIIILSAYDWSEIEKDARDAGISAFITKPLFKSRLVQVMKDVVITDDKNREESGAVLEEQTEPAGEVLLRQPQTGKRILLVEDNELNREIAEELLTAAGFLVDQAFDGQLGLEKILKMPENTYDLVLMDIQMPNMNGYEATRAIRLSGRKDLETIPILAMTADAFTEDIRKAEAAGMNGHIAKPIEIDKLMQMLEKWS